MSLSELEATVFAYYLANTAPDLTIAGRFYPTNELILVVEDKMQIACRKFGRKVVRVAKPAATQFIEQMVEKGAFSSVKGEFGGTMHQFQGDIYKTVLKEMQAADPIVAEAAAAGPDFWAGRFEALTAA